MSAIEELEKTVLALPVEQRVVLAESLLSSLPPADEVWSEAEELAEVERREREIESGQVHPLPEGTTIAATAVNTRHESHRHDRTAKNSRHHYHRCRPCHRHLPSSAGLNLAKPSSNAPATTSAVR